MSRLFAVPSVAPALDSARPDSTVTAREVEVLALLREHRTNAEIAEALFISVRTVESHVSSLMRKLRLPDRRSLGRHASEIDDHVGLPDGHAPPILPRPLTPFVGRSAERAELVAALGEHRLVTATGPGGVGKTRLAIRVAADVAATRVDGAWFVNLVQVTDPSMVVTAVAEAVGVTEQRGASVEAAVLRTLAERDGLLVVDNCEHVLESARDVIQRILERCPRITVLATSRARLLAPYERAYAVPGLSVTGDGGDAVALFSARVAAATGDETPVDSRRVASLCRSLEGVALAIELAAARFSTLGLDGLEAGLDERLRLLTSGSQSADRHRSLRGAIDWSFDLLSDSDKALVCGVSAFASWFDAGSARSVAAPSSDAADVADGLGRLADHSLLVVERGDPTRYRTLETIRQYGMERLDAAGLSDDVRCRHAAWIEGRVGSLTGGFPDEEWCAEFDRIADDVRGALMWAASELCSATGAPDQAATSRAATLAADFAHLLFRRGRLAEAQRRHEQAVDLAADDQTRVEQLRWSARTAASRWVGNDALRHFRSAADLALSLGDRAGASHDLATMSMYISRAQGIMAERPSADEASALIAEALALADGSASAAAAIAGATAFSNQRPDHEALHHARHAVQLAHDLGDGVLESVALDELLAVHLALDDIAGAVRVLCRREQVIAALELDARGGFEFGDFHLMAADTYIAAGNFEAAADHAALLERLPFFRGEDHLAMCRRLMVDALAGHVDAVVSGSERFRRGWERAGRPVMSAVARTSYAVAMVHGIRGDEAARQEWSQRTIEIGVDSERLAGCRTGFAPTFDAVVMLERGDAESAFARLEADIDDSTVFGFWDSGLWRPWYAALWAEAAVLVSDPDATSRIRRGRHAARDNPVATAIVGRAAALEDRDAEATVRYASTFASLGCPYQEARTRTLAAALA